MDVATLLSQIVEQNRRQTALLARISANVGKVISVVEDQGAIIAHLSSENKSLRIAVQDQALSFVELSKKAAPDGHWLWEGGREGKGGGRWLFSTEKYRTTSSIGAGIEPPTLLESLPRELLDLILSLLDRNEKATMCCTSIFFLVVASKSLYAEVKLDMGGAIRFLNSRLDPDRLDVKRVQVFLEPTVVLLYSSQGTRLFLSVQLIELISSPTDSVPVNVLTFDSGSRDDFASLIELFSPILALFDPVILKLKRHGQTEAPTIGRVSSTGLPCLDRWSLLERVGSYGRGSIVFLPKARRLAFRQCIQRSCSLKPVQLKGSIDIVYSDGTVVEEVVSDESALQRRLEEPLVFDATKEVEAVEVWFGKW